MFKDENNKLIESFLERTFYTGWRNPEDKQFENFGSLEFILNYKCNLSCKYCYVTRFGKELYPPEISDEKTVLRNLRTLLRWVKENNFYPKIELFSGEPLVQPIAFKALNIIIDELKGDTPRKIVIPTNYTFLLSDKLTAKVENLIKKGKNNNVELLLSASFDGKYCESNRPFIGNITSTSVSPARIWSWELRNNSDPRDDAYYDKAFAFTKKWGFGFHPMVYSEHIEDWKKNFLWFQENFQKVGHPWWYLYLLEVRNAEWSDKQLQDYMEFIKFLWRWSYRKCGNIKNLINFIFKQKGFNILQSPLSTVGRGLGCSIQGTVFVRLGDLAIVPCHRTIYEPLIYGKFKTESGLRDVKGYTRKNGTTVKDYVQDLGDQITGVEAKNAEFMIGVYSLDSANFPYCESCLINPLCNRGCLGAQYEITGDPFTPIPTVCKMYHAKIRAMIEVFGELRIFDEVLNIVNDDKREALLAVKEMMRGRRWSK